MTEPAIVIDNISYAYGRSPVLSNVNLKIEQGAFVGVIGPNGGGKTTLFRLILGFLDPDAGSISVLSKRPRRIRERVGYVPQSFRQDTHFPITVQELVLQGCLSQSSNWGSYTASDIAAAREALDTVGLLEKADSAVGTLSGGQLQRALFARSMVAKPQILLLDEPCANLDVEAEKSIYRLINQLRGTVTILMITHDLNTVIHEVDRVICIEKTVLPLLPEQVCEHFALGLYHKPILRREDS
jgi:zinc transport system ATP-binding protein